MYIQVCRVGHARRVLVPTAPLSVDMHKVSATLALIDELVKGTTDVQRGLKNLDSIQASIAISTTRFATAAAIGAIALAVISGAIHDWTLLVVAFSAAAGAYLRRGLGQLTKNPFVQPFAAAFTAGIIATVSLRLHLGGPQMLIVVCPCMILVPGPHLLNGALDLAEAHLALGAERLLYASLTMLRICAGLIVGLLIGGNVLPADAASPEVPLIYDLVAAGLAVAAYGTFFSMPWQRLGSPAAIGVIAHAIHWTLINHMHTTAETRVFLPA